MKIISLFAFLLVTISSYTQSVNDFKYALVPSKFEFQKDADQYKLNTHTKMFMQKYGFETWLDNEPIPAGIANSNCNKIFVDVIDDSGLMTTKLTVVLKDCTNKVLFTSAQGESREKEYKIAYNQALRQAFASFDNLHYKYNDLIKPPPVAETTERQSTVTTILTASGVKYNVEDLPNGFQVVNGTDVILRAWKTELANTFIAKKGNINGILFKSFETWYFQYYDNEKLITEVMALKF